MYGGFLIRGSTLTLTKGGVCGEDTSWVSPAFMNKHQELAFEASLYLPYTSPLLEAQ